MHTRFRHFLTTVVVASAVTGCDWNPTVAPENDPAFAAHHSVVSATPSELTARATSYAEILLAWRDNSTNESGFEVQRSTTGASGSFTPYATLGPNVKAMADWGVLGAKEYCYRIRNFITKGKNTTYSSVSNLACATTPPSPPAPVPAAPTNVAAKPMHSYRTIVTWTVPPNNRSAFRVEYASAPGGAWSVLTPVISGVGFAEHWYLTDEQQICYRVIATNDYGDSPPSAVDCTATPTRVTNLVATVVDANTVDVTWTDASALEDGYEVRRSGTDYIPRVIATLPANASRYRDAQVMPDSQYKYAIYPMKDLGYGSEPYHNEGNVKTLITRVPSTPSDFNATPATSSIVDMSWSTASINTQSFRIDRSTNGQLSWDSVGTAEYYQRYFGDIGQTPEVSVCYRVVARNAVGVSPASAPDCTTPPAAPTALITVPIDEMTIEVRWTDNSAVEDGYELWQYHYDWDCTQEGPDCYWVPFYSSFWMPANTTSYRISTSETLHAVAAMKDGGYSDFAVWSMPEGPASSSARASASKSRSAMTAQRSGGSARDLRPARLQKVSGKRNPSSPR